MNKRYLALFFLLLIIAVVISSCAFRTVEGDQDAEAVSPEEEEIVDALEDFNELEQLEEELDGINFNELENLNLE